jgi:hypothetical protein
MTTITWAKNSTLVGLRKVAYCRFFVVGMRGRAFFAKLLVWMIQEIDTLNLICSKILNPKSEKWANHHISILNKTYLGKMKIYYGILLVIIGAAIIQATEDDGLPVSSNSKVNLIPLYFILFFSWNDRQGKQKWKKTKVCGNHVLQITIRLPPGSVNQAYSAGHATQILANIGGIHMLVKVHYPTSDDTPIRPISKQWKYKIKYF